MTTLADRIADFETQANQLLDLPQQIADTARARINQIGNYWDQRVRRMMTVAYVHQQSGDDGAEGTEAAPLRSVEEALRRTPPGGVCVVKMMADYHFADVVPVEQTFLQLISDSSVRHAITLERKTIQWNGVPHRITAGCRLKFRGGLHVSGLNVVMPVLDGNWGTFDPVPFFCGVAQIGMSIHAGGQTVMFTYCDITIPTSLFCPVIGNGTDNRPLELYVQSCVATDQPLEGHLLSSATDPAGTATSSLPWLLTNLTNV